MLHLISKVQLRLIYENFVFCFFFALYIVLTEKGFSRFFFLFFFLKKLYNQLSRERTSSGIKIVSVGRIAPLRESCERTPEKNRVDVCLQASVNDVIRIDRLLSCGQMEIWQNRSPLSYCPVKGFLVDLHICIKDKFHCWESISLHGVSTYEKAWTKEKNQIFAIESVRFHLRENVRLRECINTEFD